MFIMRGILLFQVYLNYVSSMKPHSNLFELSQALSWLQEEVKSPYFQFYNNVRYEWKK